MTTDTTTSSCRGSTGARGPASGRRPAHCRCASSPSGSRCSLSGGRAFTVASLLARVTDHRSATYDGVRALDIDLSLRVRRDRRGGRRDVRVDDPVLHLVARQAVHQQPARRRPAVDQLVVPLLCRARLLRPRPARRAQGPRGAGAQQRRLADPARPRRSGRPVHLGREHQRIEPDRPGEAAQRRRLDHRHRACAPTRSRQPPQTGRCDCPSPWLPRR